VAFFCAGEAVAMIAAATGGFLSSGFIAPSDPVAVPCGFPRPDVKQHV